MELSKKQIKTFSKIYAKNKWKKQEFNLFSIRNLKNLRKDVFNDLSGFWMNGKGYIFQSTTDPSKWCIEKKGPGNGALFLKAGFHPESLCIDLHNKRIKRAFCSRAKKRYSDGKWAGCNPQKILRDSNADFNIKREKQYVGHFGANMHHANKWRILKNIGRYGEGCRVVVNWKEMDFILDESEKTGMYKNNPKVTLFSEAIFELGQYKEIDDIYKSFDEWK